MPLPRYQSRNASSSATKQPPPGRRHLLPCPCEYPLQSAAIIVVATAAIPWPLGVMYPGAAGVMLLIVSSEVCFSLTDIRNNLSPSHTALGPPRSYERNDERCSEVFPDALTPYLSATTFHRQAYPASRPFPCVLTLHPSLSYAQPTASCIPSLSLRPSAPLHLSLALNQLHPASLPDHHRRDSRLHLFASASHTVNQPHTLYRTVHHSRHQPTRI